VKRNGAAGSYYKQICDAARAYCVTFRPVASHSG
jgi:hypothetical protein